MLIAFAGLFAAQTGDTPKAMISVNPYQRDAPEGLLRRALPPKDPFALLGENGPTIQYHRTAKHERLSVPLLLPVAANGSVTCQLEQAKLDELADVAAAKEAATLACREILAAGKWTPALDREGRRLAFDYRLRLRFLFRHRMTDNQKSRSIVEDVIPSAPMMPMRNVTDIKWYEGYGSNFRLSGFPKSSVDPQLIAEGRPGWAGIVLFKGQDGAFKCAAARRSGDAAFDAKACAAALAVPQPDAASMRPGRYAKAIAVPTPTGIAFITQDEPAQSPAHFSAAAKIRLAALVKAKGGNFARVEPRGIVDAKGGVTQCSISRTSGSDAADVALCRELESTGGLLLPATDLYGRPSKGYIAPKDDDVAAR